MSTEAHTFEAAASAAASKATYGGAGSVLLGTLLSNEFAVGVGIVIGVAGFCVNWYYQHRAARRAEAEIEARERRAQAEHDARMKELGQ